jgi:pilus assembly protein Flp/PilA
MLLSFGNLVMAQFIEQEGDMRLLRRCLQDETGATAIEYGQIAAVFALAIIASVKGVSNNLKSTFNNVPANLR